MVEESRQRSPELESAIVYIYCDQAELNTLTATSILGSFVKQLLLHLILQGKPWPSSLRKNLQRELGQGRESLLPQELTNILLELLPSLDRAIFFVDGLDECVSKESNQVLQSLGGLLRNLNVKLRVFVTSREEVDARGYLSGCFHISVSEENVAPDIYLYIERAVATNIVNKGLTGTPSVIQNIKTSLVRESQGM